MREKKKAVEALRRAGGIPPAKTGSMLPGQLTIADYLKAKGDGSSLPIPSSGGTRKASKVV